jgi:putative aminopeptidase FrvX
MVTALKTNGRLAVCPIGTWSSRFAEGARVTVFTDEGPRRGTILPLLASGHVFGDDIDKQRPRPQRSAAGRQA